MSFTIEIERENDGRWIADVVGLPGVMAYGTTRDEAVSSAKALALRVLADTVEESRKASVAQSVSFACA